MHNSCLVSIIIYLTACGGGQVTHSTQEDTAKKNTETAVGAMPETLENFDKTYEGTLNNIRIQMNLRRYGNSLSGTYWNKNDTKEFTFKGFIKDGSAFVLTVFGKEGKIGIMEGQLEDTKLLKGNWKPESGTAGVFNLNEVLKATFAVRFDEVSVHKDGKGGSQVIRIDYPQILDIQDPTIANKVNGTIEGYFHYATLEDSLDKIDYGFKEDVKYAVTYIGHEVASINKQHHVSRNNGTQIVDDSHGMNLNFKRGKLYELQDFFKPNTLDQLNNLIFNKINKSCGGILEEDIKEKCKMKPEETFSFSMEKDKITFHLTERLPYKYRGCGYVRVEYKALKDYINPSGPLAEFVKK